MGVAGVGPGDDAEILMGGVELAQVLEDDGPAVTGGEVVRVALEHLAEQVERLGEVILRDVAAGLLGLLRLHADVVQQGDRQIDLAGHPPRGQFSDLAEGFRSGPVAILLHGAEALVVGLQHLVEDLGRDGVRGGIGRLRPGPGPRAVALAAGDRQERGRRRDDGKARPGKSSHE
ncbi:MAG: hypothetical protein U0800_22395 [Isosphaeraceae bacterium]